MSEELAVMDNPQAQALSQNVLQQTGGSMVTGNPWSDPVAFEQLMRVSQAFAQSTLIPQNYQGKVADCMIAVEMANRMDISPVFVMQNLYIVKGKPSWAGQACMAMINACGKFRDVKHVYFGEKGKDSRGCYVSAVRISDGETVNGTEVTMAMAKAEGWTSNSKWRNMPEQMLGYRAASFFARMYCPESLMGLQTAEEVEDVATTKQPNRVDLTNALKSRIAEPEPEAEEQVTEAGLICTDCGKEVTPFASYTAKQVAQIGVKAFGVCLCADCSKKRQAAAQGATGSAERDGDADG